MAGAVNYKKNLVIDVVSSVLPAGMEAWRIVAAEDSSEEEDDYDGVDEEQDFDATSTPTTGMVRLTIMDTPAATEVRKRKAPPADADNKSKNCRNANPRTSAASAINNLVNQIGNNSSNNQMMQMMQSLDFSLENVPCSALMPHSEACRKLT